MKWGVADEILVIDVSPVANEQLCMLHMTILTRLEWEIKYHIRQFFKHYAHNLRSSLSIVKYYTSDSHVMQLGPPSLVLDAKLCSVA